MLYNESNNGTTLRESLKGVRKPNGKKVRQKLKDAKDKIIQKKRDIVQRFKRGKGDKGDSGTVRGAARDNNEDVDANEEKEESGGFIVLGMHRSGTSMLAGLLVEGFGYNPGEPLIQPAYDNEKGFYELVPAVLQNDVFMSLQHIDWATNVWKYDPDVALKAYNEHQIETFRAQKALKFLNNEASKPWLQKDPRMCITMRTWLPLLNTKPAVIFTYRQPLEVALSLKKRQGFPLERGLRLWIHYNKAAVINSADLCRVLSSNNAVLADPLGETKRIASELTTKCNVPPSPKMIDQKTVDSFVDTSLQHNKNKLKARDAQQKVLEKHGDCVVKDFDSTERSPLGREREMNIYLKAMKIYCDFESGKAYEEDYEWPEM